MKIELETIPVWDSIRTNSECFLCELMKEAESHAVDYYLGSSVMHSETRVTIHKTGFCPKHWQKLAEAGKPQSLALISHTYMKHTLDSLKPALSSCIKAKTARKSRQLVKMLLDSVIAQEHGCLICTAMQSRLERYAVTAVSLWRDDQDFHREFMQGKGVCLHHMEPLFLAAPSILTSTQECQFYAELAELVSGNLKRLEDDVWWMTQKYKAEHTNSPWNGCEDAHKRLVHKIIGEGRIVSES